MSMESAITKNVRLHPLVIDQNIKRLDELQIQIRNHLQHLGIIEIYEVGSVFYARSIGPMPLPENVNLIAGNEMIEGAKKYLDYFESISLLDKVLLEVTGKPAPTIDWSGENQERLKFMIEVTWARKNELCIAGKDPRMSAKDKGLMVGMLADENKEEGKKIIDVINSPLFHGSVNAARKLIKYLELDEQTKKDLNTAVLNMVNNVAKQAHQLRIRQGYDTITMKLPTSDGPNNGILALARLIQYCNVGVEKLHDYRPTIISWFPYALAERKFYEECNEGIAWRLQMFASGGGFFTDEEVGRELGKGIQGCSLIDETARGPLIMAGSTGTTPSYTDIGAVWKRIEQITRHKGTGIYKSRSEAAYVSRTLGEGSVARETVPRTEEKGPGEDSGERRGVAQATPSRSRKKGTTPRTTKINGDAYVEFIVREKKDIPQEAIHQDGIYWVPKFFNFGKYFDSLKQSKENQPSKAEGKEKAMVTRAGETTKTVHDIGASPVGKIEKQNCGIEKKAQDRVGDANETQKEKCLAGRTDQSKPPVLSLAFDSACSKAIITNPNVLVNPVHHKVRIDGANPNHPLQSSLGGYIDGYVLSESGMRIQFPKDLHVLHCDDSAADLLSVRQCLRNGWCKAVLDEE